MLVCRFRLHYICVALVIPIWMIFRNMTSEPINQRMADFESKLTEMFAENHRLESEILAQLKSLKFNS